MMPTPLSSTKDVLAVIGIGVPAILLFVGFVMRFFSLSDISSALAFALVTIMVGSGASILLGRLLRGTELGRLVMKTADRGYDPDVAARLDPKLADVHALFFWPKKASWEKGQRNPNVTMPYFKTIIKGNDVFWWAQYAEDIFRKGKIQHNSAPGNFENDEEAEAYLRKRGYNLRMKPVSPADLLENGT